ncbi:RNA-binding protein pop5 [Exophiala xenobiotica]|nr:RNA-binding protein pop5 [Exophiala xenobiotica]KAK5217431.1 RNA-binding protein pop5 [Exophiala xenobiotica]KAK5232779.1 RNA-binding protein pop5 [Exophiala xenobiotica]KAK5255483.1 RNA-binding protein pop5 [Exophiala xenobiotica]KAK5287872.1 RNA-binding protein pop5 [Exophiala xenobiotica]
MVRIKQRYILFNVLYPGTTTPPPQPSSQTPTPSYVLFSRPSPPHLNGRLLLSTIRSTIQSLFGDHGMSVVQSSLRIMYFSPSTSTVILRVPRAHFRLVWASLTFMDTVPGPQRNSAPVQCVIRVTRARRDIVRAKRQGREDEDETMLQGLLDKNKAQRPGNAATLRVQDEEDGIIDLDDEEDMEDISD